MVGYSVLGRETISSVSSSTGFTASNIPPADADCVYARIQAIDGVVRFAIDGSIPSTSLGLRLMKDASVEVWGDQALIDFRCIDDGGTAKLEVIYMGRGG